MQAHAQLPWWIVLLAIPACFTVFGALLGFFVAEMKDKLQARRTRAAFLAAIAVELETLKNSLEEASKQAQEFVTRVQVAGHAPQLVPRWGTKVFDTQLGKLRDVADKLVLQTIETYAPVGRIERIAVMVNEHSRDFASSKPGNEKAEAQKRLISALRALGEEIDSSVPKMQALIREIKARHH
jgi:hypothetical protein